MYLILFVLNDITFCEEVLDAWDKTGVRGITILPSTGLARMRKAALREDLPLFPSIRDLFEHGESLNRTLFTVIDKEEMIDDIVEATESVIGNLDQPNTGILTVIPLTRVYGLSKKPNK